MIVAACLLVAALVLPLALAAACLAPRWRARVPGLLGLAPLPGLLAAVLAPALVADLGAPGGALVLSPAWLRMGLTLDGPGAMLLGASALLWSAAGFYASATMAGKPDADAFAGWWLLTLAGSLGVFVASDLTGFYLVYSLVSLAAYGLVAHDGTASAQRAGAVYVALAVLGEACLLLAFVLLSAAAPDHSLGIRDGVAGLAASPWRDGAIALVVAGFAMKIGLVPVHVWMPLAYRAAPIPAAAAMSGAAVKAGVIGLVRFLPFDTPLAGWGMALAAGGLVSAFYGVGVGLTQRNPKTVLAYSSVSQMGVIATVAGMGLAAAEPGIAGTIAFYAVHHVLAKGGLFLALGVAAAAGRDSRVWPVLVPATIVALGMGGLPFSGGALAKLAVKDTLGNGLVGILGGLSAAGSTLLMLHFLACLRRRAAPEAQALPGRVLLAAWLCVAAASLVVPWLLYPWVTGKSAASAFGLDALWYDSWPVALGAALAMLLRRQGSRLPRLPAGDIVVLGEAALPRAAALAGSLERADAVLRRWPVASLLLIALALALGGALSLGH